MKIRTLTILMMMLLMLALSMTACQKAPDVAPAEPTTTESETTTVTASETGTVELTMDELSKFNGKDGNMAYIAVDGIIYDVSSVPAWTGGEHQGKYKAGIDATEIIKGSPHGKQVLEKLPVVGKVKQ